MKVLIWFGCICCASFFIVILANHGITLGGIPTIIIYGITFWAARSLSEKWEVGKSRREYLKNQENETYTEDELFKDQ